MLWAVGILVALVAMALLVDKRYPGIWENLSRARIEQVASLIAIGVTLTAIIVLLAIGGAALEWTGFGGKTLWDWLQILSAIAIPAVLTVAGFWFSSELDQRQRKAEALRAETEHRVEQQRARDAALQAYLDQMSTLLLDEDLRKDLRNSGEDSEVLTLAQARTATVIQRLDAQRNRNVIRFLNEASLTGVGQSSNSLLSGANLNGADLENVDLSTIDLSGANLNGADLRDANLSGADLSEAKLADAKLKEANLQGADLSDAKLSDATLSEVELFGADLSGTNLREAKLSEAKLVDAKLKEANLRDSQLSGADLTEADLSDSTLMGANLSNASLWGAIMEQAKLSGATLSGASLRGTDLSSANRTGIFHDSFYSNSGGWTTHRSSEKEPYVIEYANGGLRMYNPPPPGHMLNLSYGGVSAIEDAMVEVDATVTGKAPERKFTHWGIICRAVDDNNYYTLGIYADGRPTIWRLKDNQWKELRTGKNPSDAVRDGTATNHLQANCSGNKLTLYVNGRRVIQEEDSEFKSGRVGLYVETNQNGEGIDVSFDNFLVSTTMPDGTLFPGEFESVVSLEFPEGGGFAEDAAAPDFLFIQGPEGSELNFTNPLHIFDPSNPSEQKKLPAPETANEWVTWFQTHPNLDTSKPVPASVGDASGKQIDVTVTSTPENYPKEICGEQPCVPLYPLSDESGLVGYEGYKDRFIILDVGGETVLIDATAPTDTFDEFLPKAQKVLDSVEWKGG